MITGYLDPEGRTLTQRPSTRTWAPRSATEASTSNSVGVAAKRGTRPGAARGTLIDWELWYVHCSTLWSTVVYYTICLE